MRTKPSILVVDDSIDSRQMLAEYLAFREFQVSEARNGTESIKVAHRLQPDVILMDLSMPIMDGWEATRQLKADPLTRNVIIIAVTAHAFPAEQEAARLAGCDAVISKPYDLTVLASTIERAISKGSSARDSKTAALEAAPRQIVKTTMSDAAPTLRRRTAVLPTSENSQPSRKKKPAKSSSG